MSLFELLFNNDAGNVIEVSIFLKPSEKSVATMVLFIFTSTLCSFKSESEREKGLINTFRLQSPEVKDHL